MLSRIAQISLRYRYSAALQPSISNVPQVIKQTKTELEQLNKLTQDTSIPNFGDYTINFAEQVDGKRLILQSLPQIRTGFNIADVSTALLSIGTAYGILSNFNYVLTLAFAVGAFATTVSAGRINLVRNENMISVIEIDRNERLHITYLTKVGYDTLIVDKKDFTYNVLQPGRLGTNAIWCKVNNDNLWISKKNLEINNQQFHNLL